jgi:hypothetical protein
MTNEDPVAQFVESSVYCCFGKGIYSSANNA